VGSIHRFLDRFHQIHKSKVEWIAFEHSRKVLGGQIAVVFYDMTTLYFEAEDEDDLRKIGFSKDGKFQNPQIMLGLLVGENGYPIAYDIYEGNTFEGHTLIPVLECACTKFGLKKPIIVADSGLLSKSNIEELKALGYVFIVGARIKNESIAIKKEILTRATRIKHGDSFALDVSDTHKLIIGYSDAGAKKDAANRDRGIVRLQRRIKTGRLTKKALVNQGYNKFLKVESDVQVSIDQDKIIEDTKWDGLKGYVTNPSLPLNQVIANYNHLWAIERAFRISKTDLRIRPIFHRKKDRIKAHVCIAFVAYSVFKELERRLHLAGLGTSAQRAIELSKTIFEITLSLPDSHGEITTFSRLTDEQRILLECLLPEKLPPGGTG
jgi:transposase